VHLYTIKGWTKFQHYKKRNPPWVKLHFSLLSSEDWVSLDDASRVLAIACMLIASRNEGKIDGSEKGLAYLKRVAYLNKKPDLNPLILCGFLECDSESKQMLADARPETETETETETEKHLSALRTMNGSKRFAEFWNAYPKKVKKAESMRKWKSKHLDDKADEIIADIQIRLADDKRWKDGFIPDPTTYLNGERWNDEVSGYQ